ncbi:MAG TPA: tRNA guanosine(34) transglycosylase Tgt [Anaerolineae bacterium]
MIQQLQLPHGALDLPAFLPDGTQGVVRAVDAQDLLAVEIQAVQMNVFHLMQRPGSSTIQALGGLHQMAGWPRPIFTDSGGFQVYSLLRQNAKSGSITDRGAVFRPEGTDRKFNLTPEKSVQLQLSYGSDVIICLDDCTHPEAPLAVQRESVERTILWARRCKETFETILGQQGVAEAERPLIMGVIQGGQSRELRRHCAEALLEIGFDAYGYGGWPLDSEGNLLQEMLVYTRELVPAQFPVHGLGVGHPDNVVASVAMGYNVFDSTMPTRDARHGRLYAFMVDPANSHLDGNWFQYVYPNDKKHVKRNEPVSPYCDCLLCRHYSLGYLHHLFKLNDSLYPRLATIHNLRFMTQLMENLRDA